MLCCFWGKEEGGEIRGVSYLTEISEGCSVAFILRGLYILPRRRKPDIPSKAATSLNLSSTARKCSDSSFGGGNLDVFNIPRPRAPNPPDRTEHWTVMAYSHSTWTQPGQHKREGGTSLLAPGGPPERFPQHGLMCPKRVLGASYGLGSLRHSSVNRVYQCQGWLLVAEI